MIIRDPETRDWRVFRPWDQENGGDKGREAEAKPVPPLIPPRYIEELVWERRGDRVFSVCRLVTGWEIFALNSAGDPSQAQGFDVHLYHIDEDTANVGWYEEAVGRTAMPKGLIRWTALPHSKNDDILNMVQRAADDEKSKEKTTVCIRASMFDNPYYPEESRQANLRIWAAQGEDVVRKRAYGEMVTDSVLMYPSFSKWVHMAVPEDPEKASAAQRAFVANHCVPPNNWCLDMVVDPGHTICAVAFLATPPPELGDCHFLYDELYLMRCDASMFGDAVQQKIGSRQFERFIIDAHGGRLTDFGSGIRPQRQYEMQLKERRLKCNELGNFFMNGSDDIEGREVVLRQWLRIGPDGHPMFYVHVPNCPNFVREMERFKKKQRSVNGQMVTLDEGNRSMPCHLVECVEYAAAHGLKYVKPRTSKAHSTFVKWVLDGRAQRERQRRVNGPHAGGRSISLAPRGADS